jgi:hypothetical protein
MALLAALWHMGARMAIGDQVRSRVRCITGFETTTGEGFHVYEQLGAIKNHFTCVLERDGAVEMALSRYGGNFDPFHLL